MFQQLRLRKQNLEKVAEEQDKESGEQILLVEEENHRKQMLSNPTAWRKANLACKLAIDNNEKDELLQNGDPSIRQRKMTWKACYRLKAALHSLRRVSRMMSQQVQQSEESVRTLATSSRTIQETNEEF
ncbi:hypothetical protein scyTo_0019113 [Scyliorhinus torazame]|uniref:Sec20 C-terminal domain-containing protein n=1 Tax=Scyliorhinus torazame TaxID=75743 RepID=A0A401PT02_SCYTO|nr:hypothetical protein [Scyliorhinus torazame]